MISSTSAGSTPTGRPYRSVAWIFTVFLVVFGLASAVPPLLLISGIVDLAAIAPWLPHFVVKTLMIVAVSVWTILGGPGAAGRLGLRRAMRPVPWGRVAATGLALGAATSATILLLGADGLQPLFVGWSFLAIVLSVWVYSSVTEEFFVRGWFQASVESSVGRGPGVLGGRLSLPVAASALLFGAMHLSLFVKGIDLVTTVVIVTAATVLGGFAAILRERHRGLMPSIIVHVCFNLGGAAAGFVITVVRHVLAATAA